LAPRRRANDDRAVQVILSSQGPDRRALVAPILLGAVVGLVLLVGGCLLAYLTLGTTFLHQFMPIGRATTSQLIAGAIAWSFALTAPALFGIVGLVRLIGVLELIGAARPRTGRTAQLARALPDDLVLATRVRLPDGRLVPELVVGPFGAAVIEELPPAGAVRHRGATWEVRTSDGQWRAMEHPLDRAARDAERVRRWLEADDRDHVVKTYAVVVASDAGLERSAACAVVTPEQLPAWLAALPPQRTLNESRRDRIVELVRSAV
jgi:hypothetical protein